MTHVNRRGFIQVSSAGAAALGMLAVAPSMLGRQIGQPMAAPTASIAAATEPFVAYIRNAADGEIALHVGVREVIIHDAELVARLVKALG